MSAQVDVLAKETKIKKASYLAALKRPKSLGLPKYAKNRPEGFLFPDTYELTAESMAASTMKQMVTQYKAVSRGDRPGVRGQARLLPVRSADRGQHHRARGEPRGGPGQGGQGHLQPAGEEAQAGDGLHRHLRRESHDHDHDGEGPAQQVEVQHLPVQGPAAGTDRAPGRAALQAAANPEKGKWMYFVTVNLEPGRPSSRRPEAEFEKIRLEFVAWCSANPGRCGS